MGKTLIADETDPYPKSFRWGSRVEAPFATVGLIVDVVVPGRLYEVAWIGPTGRPIEAKLPHGSLRLIAPPSPAPPKG